VVNRAAARGVRDWRVGGLAENGGTWLVPGGADPLDLEEVRVDTGHKAAIA
jgi:hypothetical protein